MTPYQHVGLRRSFSAFQLWAENFTTEGEYRIRFFYSTEEADIKGWLGDRHTSEGLEKCLDQVPKTTIRSNEITIRVVRRKN